MTDGGGGEESTAMGRYHGVVHNGGAVLVGWRRGGWRLCWRHCELMTCRRWWQRELGGVARVADVSFLYWRVGVEL